MGELIGAFGGMSLILAIIMTFVLAILWIITPFYIISIRNELRETNRLLRTLGKEIRSKEPA